MTNTVSLSTFLVFAFHQMSFSMSIFAIDSCVSMVSIINAIVIAAFAARVFSAGQIAVAPMTLLRRHLWELCIGGLLISAAVTLAGWPILAAIVLSLTFGFGLIAFN